MDWILNAVLGFADLFEVRSNDPVVAEYRYTRRALIVAVLAALGCLLLIFMLPPDDAPGNVSVVANSIVSTVTKFLLLAAAALTLWGGWCAIKCVWICYWPERYFGHPDNRG